MSQFMKIVMDQGGGCEEHRVEDDPHDAEHDKGFLKDTEIEFAGDPQVPAGLSIDRWHNDSSPCLVEKTSVLSHGDIFRRNGPVF